MRHALNLALVTTKPALLAWLVVLWLACGAHADTLRDFSERCALSYASALHVPVELVDAIIEVESDWNPFAVSRKGAVGLMQLMPATAARFGVEDRFDIEENIRGGVAYLAWLMRLFRGDLRLVTAAYLAGEAPILRRGLAYSSPQVFRYVSHVALRYRMLRRKAAQRSAQMCCATRFWTKK